MIPDLDCHPRTICDDLRHCLLNHVRALEGMFRTLRRPNPAPTVHERVMRYLGQTICDLSVLVRSQRVPGLLDHGGWGVLLNAVPFQITSLFQEAGDQPVAQTIAVDGVQTTFAVLAAS